MQTFEAYLEDFHEISILVSKKYHNGNINSFYAVSKHETLPLEIMHKETFETVKKYIVRFTGFIKLNEYVEVIDEHGARSELFSGQVVRTELFDELFYYDGDDLGVTYKKDASVFKIWTPVAKRVNVLLKDGDDYKAVPMHYTNQGVWRVRIAGDLDGQAYLYEAYVNGKMRRFTDPCAISSDANGHHSYVIDKNKVEPMEHNRPFHSVHPVDAIIYEASIRDMTVDATIEASEPATFNAFSESGLKTRQGNPAGIDYLKTLGITHVQLLPFYDFEGVDETDRFKHYNWGYNPSQYNVPEGSFTLTPDDPYARINELRRMIDRLHSEGLSVIMDVVYNHVYNIKTFPFEKMVPGYAYRVDENGVLTESSGCGSDNATERKMIRKFIIDSVLFWADFYRLDGFRFDLMGLIDATTMNVLRQKLESIDTRIMVHGEGWQMPAPLPDDQLAHMNNPRVLFNVGFFNDETREVIKGETFKEKSRGYAMGNLFGEDNLRRIVQSKTHLNGGIQYPSQSINYVECHDNHTFFDKAKKAMEKANPADRLRAQKLATSMMVLMQGVPFLHMGQEFYRSKNGVSNSYKSPDEINMISWDKVDTHMEDIEDLKQLIEIRNTHPLFRLRTVYDIDKHTYVRVRKSGTAVYELRSSTMHLIVIFKNNNQKETFAFDDAFELLYHSEASRDSVSDPLTLSTISTTILKQNR